MGLKVVYVGAIVLLLIQFGWAAVADDSVSMDFDNDDAGDIYDYEDKAYMNKIIRVSKKKKHGSLINCNVKKDVTRTDNVNKLSPFDVEVVAALGDSLTAGFGAGASSILTFSREYKGISWSIGGKSSLSRVTTLPNILKKFNPKLVGFSVKTKKSKSKEAFNRAVSGAKVKHLLGQAKDLVKQMTKKRQMEKWKVITIFIGGNDLCDGCKKSESSVVKNYMRDLKKALSYLSGKVKYAFINLALVLDVSILKPLRGFCGLVHYFACSCVKKQPKKVSRIAEAINKAIVQQYQNQQPYDRKDFAVVVQPLYSQTKLPLKTKKYLIKRKCRIGGGRKRKCPVPDRSYLAPDCFHFSEKAQAMAATYLWNNMLQPVGKKTAAINWNRSRKLNCPSSVIPYFRTNSNSKLAL